LPDQYSTSTESYLQNLFAAERHGRSCQAQTLDQLLEWQFDARHDLYHIVGLQKMREELTDHLPEVEPELAEDLGDYTRTRCTIETEPGFALPFWLLQPKSDGPHPLAILPHGHDKHGMDTTVGLAHDEEHAARIEAEDRDVAVQAVRRGYVAIAPAARGTSGDVGIPDIGRRHGARDCRSQLMHALIAGRTATAERVWDVIKLIDWALSSFEIDESNILVMGNSGGGVITIYSAACDDRITCAVPSCSYVSLVSESGFIHHCDCNAVPGISRWGEMWDLAALIAPRRLCIVNGREDGLFPIPEVDRAVAGARRIYDTIGHADRFEHHYGPAGHRFYSDLMWPFISKIENR
jgi:dienelactone hydrolase